MGRIMWVIGVALLCAMPRASTAQGASATAQPPGTVAVNFSMDDRLNRIYGDGDLKWKGSFYVDPATRILVRDDTWSGGAALEGFPTLYDDGPWTVGGHEPAGAKPGDHVWGTTVFVVPPQEGELAFQYGVIDAVYEWNYGNGWMWLGPNGAFVVAAGATTPVTAAGERFAKFGKQELGFTVDVNAIRWGPPGWVGVKSAWWGWAIAPLDYLGNGIWSFDLEPWITNGVLMHTGLMHQGASAEFVIVLDGYDYVVWTWDGTNWVPEFPLDGVTVRTRCKNASVWTSQPVTFAPDGNPIVMAPSECAE
jgi:hypothetical protein